MARLGRHRHRSVVLPLLLAVVGSATLLHVAAVAPAPATDVLAPAGDDDAAAARFRGVTLTGAKAGGAGGGGKSTAGTTGTGGAKAAGAEDPHEAMAAAAECPGTPPCSNHGECTPEYVCWTVCLLQPRLYHMHTPHHARSHCRHLCRCTTGYLGADCSVSEQEYRVVDLGCAAGAVLPPPVLEACIKATTSGPCAAYALFAAAECTAMCPYVQAGNCTMASRQAVCSRNRVRCAPMVRLAFHSACAPASLLTHTAHPSPSPPLCAVRVHVVVVL